MSMRLIVTETVKGNLLLCGEIPCLRQASSLRAG